ncbi:hypothetical protein amb1329 [Paramagnetospirillum magneticum AMB-1]|uniref:Uncharacterized protein n=1 Tax=Paramagnetospirillum magneticum (strain ATCC 700264 / AMB-1) TaxID=342108 RepID=Q2W7P2_PARM1|nr:hypothetical protein amb1329 [Paramagnetospirillum magneticum AMB-1]
MPNANQTFTAHVDPVSPPMFRPASWAGKFGGGAGYRPRVRNVYSVWRLAS